ncbi:collagen-like protein [Weissella muntiaci]|uniref:Collagen-like protein n=2 Tax=Weissella muntiaci TaxID=2508881 RepID=A0A6C2C9X9_9LACO|nr:collagen-like protein [Weissella muntiaci]
MQEYRISRKETCMREIKTMSDLDNKVSDTATKFLFRLISSGVNQQLSGDEVSVSIANDGYLFDVKPRVIDDLIELDFTDENLTKLVPGHYSLEINVSKPDGTVEIYPSSGSLGFEVSANLKEVEGSLIPEVTFDYVLKAMDEKIQQVKVGPQGIQGIQGETGPSGKDGEQGPQGVQGKQGEQGVQGIQGVAGKDFSIAETFPSYSAMNGKDLTKGDFVIISSDVDDPHNAELYLWNGTEFTLITDMSGATGIKGDTGEQGPQGIQGIQGEQGVQGVKGDEGPQGPAGKDAIGTIAIVDWAPNTQYLVNQLVRVPSLGNPRTGQLKGAIFRSVVTQTSDAQFPSANSLSGVDGKWELLNKDAYLYDTGGIAFPYGLTVNLIRKGNIVFIYGDSSFKSTVPDNRKFELAQEKMPLGLRVEQFGASTSGVLIKFTDEDGTDGVDFQINPDGTIHTTSITGFPANNYVRAVAGSYGTGDAMIWPAGVPTA